MELMCRVKRQPVVALSTAEAEFMAASSQAMVQEVIYVRRLLEKLGFPQTDPTPFSRITPRASSGQVELSGAQTE